MGSPNWPYYVLEPTTYHAIYTPLQRGAFYWHSCNRSIFVIN
nr:MAG TPA: hypothetical protein [Caudoviricetes sp.]